MIISIFASIGAQNLGDELILKNEIKLLEKKYGKNTRFIVFSYDPINPFLKKSNIEYKEYFPIGIKNIKNIYRNIKNLYFLIKTTIKSDLIVIGGGGIIYDSEFQKSKNPLNQWVFRTKFFYLLKKDVLFYAVGINIEYEINYNKVNKIFSKAKKITVRDKYSFDLLKNLGIKSSIIKDPVFNESSNKIIKSFLIKKIHSNFFSYKDLYDVDILGKKIALAFRKGYLSKDSEIEKEKINDLISYILDRGGEVILLPHSFHKKDKLANDYIFLNQFLRINEKIRILSSMEDVYSKYIYKEFDLCLAMRLHSIILSQVYEIPFIGINYSKKTDEILKNLI